MHNDVVLGTCLTRGFTSCIHSCHGAILPAPNTFDRIFRRNISCTLFFLEASTLNHLLKQSLDEKTLKKGVTSPYIDCNIEV